MRSILFSGLALCFGLLVACETSTPDGNIPSDYVAEAKKLVGTYKGSFNSGARGSLVFTMKGQRAILSFMGGDIVGSGCHTRIGQLTSVSGSSRSGLEKAVFALSSNCASGDSLTLTVSGGKVLVSILKSSHTYETCPSASQINSCESEVGRKHAFDHDAYTKKDAFGRECSQDAFGGSQCESTVGREIDSCSECSSETTYSYVEGSFRR